MLNARVVVTGGGSGIGFDVCKSLASQGASVISASLEHPAADNRALSHHPGNVTDAHLDVRDEASVVRFFKGLDESGFQMTALVNCAGIIVFQSLEKTSLSEWNDTWTTNVTGTFLCCREAIRHMQRSGGGRILNVGSISGVSGIENNGAYGASKAAVHLLTSVINEEYARQGILGTALILGAVGSHIWESRPEFSTSNMLTTQEVSRVVASILALSPETRVDEIRVLHKIGVFNPDRG